MSDQPSGATANRTDDPAGDEAMLARLDDTLQGAGIFVGAEIDRDTLVLSGEVETEESHQAALDVARALAEPRGLRLDDSIDVLDVSPDNAFVGDDTAEQLGGGAFAYADPDANPSARFDPTFELEADFTGSVGPTNPEESAAEAEPYFFPTDPVVRPTNNAEQLEVVGGFEATAMDDLTGAAGFDVRNDDDLARAVLAELAGDALTTDLAVRVRATAGVVRLRGEVPTLDDAENAEAVASRVGGVQEVIEELLVTEMERTE